MKHYCYYCNCEITKDITLVTFYTKICKHCNVSYHIMMPHDIITLIVLTKTIQDKEYVVTHEINTKITSVFKRRKEFIWDQNNNTMEILPIKIIEFSANHNMINPSNLNERLKTILTFL